MAKYLDDNGLLYFWGKIKAWVTNQGYTKNTGTITSVTTTAGAHTAINVSSGGVSFKVPTQTSHLTNNSNFVADANYVHTDNNFTSTLKTKLDGIAAGAEVNVVKSIDSTTEHGVYLVLNDSDGELDIVESSGTITEDTTNPSRNYYVTGLTVATALGGVRTYIDNNLALKANIASPTFTGTPAAPTATAGTNTTQIATTAFVTNAVSTAVAGQVVKSVDTTAGTSGINLSLSNAGALDVTITSGSVASGNSNFVTGGAVSTAIEESSATTLEMVENMLGDYAPKASPALTGTPTAPTAAAGTDTTQIATTAFVTTAIANASVGAATFKGVISSGTAISSLTDYKAGWYWIVDTAGTYVGQKCEPGDFIYCIKNYGGTYKASDFSVVQTNLDIAAITNAEIDVICSDGSMTGPN